jgi:hypothetical protein
MSKARDLANAGTALGAVDATELGYLDGVTSAVQTQVDAKTAKSTLTTTGDIYYASSANTPARLGIGSSAQVLTVASGIPSWATPAGGQLKEVVFTSTNASYTIPTGVTGFWALCVGSGGGGGASSTASATNGGGGGGAGQAIEKYFAIVGDTTLNITVPSGGTGGTAGGKGTNGSVATIVGNTSATTYLSAAGGGGGGGGAAANVTPNNGASGGGLGRPASNDSGSGGGMGGCGNDITMAPFGGVPTIGGNGGTATTLGVTGSNGGGTGQSYPGTGINIFGRAVAGGGGGGFNSVASTFGGGAGGGGTTVGSAATANTGGGGGGAGTSTSIARAGGNGGSGLVILRYVG